MPEPLSEEQLREAHELAAALTEAPRSGFSCDRIDTRILQLVHDYDAGAVITALLAEVTRLRAERAAIEAECQAIARQVPNAVGPIARVMALFSPKETL